MNREGEDVRERLTIWWCPDCGEVAGTKTGFESVRSADAHGHRPVTVEVVPATQLADRDRALEACARVSGADLSDGLPTRPALPDYALQQVQTLRQDYDDALGELADRDREIERLRDQLHALFPQGGSEIDRTRRSYVVVRRNLDQARGEIERLREALKEVHHWDSAAAKRHGGIGVREFAAAALAPAPSEKDVRERRCPTCAATPGDQVIHGAYVEPCDACHGTGFISLAEKEER